MSPQETPRSPFADQIESLDAATLSPIAANALGLDGATVTDWGVSPISRGSTSAGVWRIGGQAEAAGQTRSWSAILKMMRRVTGDYEGFFAPTDEPSSVTYWRREFELYRSRMLANLPIPFRPVHCLVTEERDGALWCWLEDLGDIEAARWTDEQFALAARHLGMFNGLWLNQRPLPDAPWLCRGLVRWRHDRLALTERDLRDGVAALLQHLDLSDIWGEHVVDASWQLWADCPGFVDALEALPKTFMHQDAGRKSLSLRERQDRRKSTTAIDWDFCGIGEVGGEIATLVASSSRWFGLEPERLERVEALVLAGYLDGLRTMGWRGDEEQVRLAYALTTAVMFRPALSINIWRDPERYRAGVEATMGRSLEDWLGRWGQVSLFVLQKAQQARDILGMSRAMEVGRD